MPLPTEMREAAQQAIHAVAAQSGRKIEQIADADSLTDKLGLDSLDLAQVVVSLEQRFGVDPFRTPGKPLRTFADLVSAFAAASAQHR